MKLVSTKFGNFSITDTGKIIQTTFPKKDISKLLKGKSSSEVADLIMNAPEKTKK